MILALIAALLFGKTHQGSAVRRVAEAIVETEGLCGQSLAMHSRIRARASPILAQRERVEAVPQPLVSNTELLLSEGQHTVAQLGDRNRLKPARAKHDGTITAAELVLKYQAAPLPVRGGINYYGPFPRKRRSSCLLL